MKRFILFLILAISCLSLLAATAEAKRLGGGTSIGKQRTMSTPMAPAAPAAAPAPQPIAPVTTPATPPAGNRWLGPLAGLAIGAGLGALFAGGGMGGILTALIVVAGVMFLISLLRKSQAQAAPTQYAGAGASYAPQPVQQPHASGSAAAPNIPADFPAEAFLRSAKMSFIRLQAANDRKDADDIREYTTPEMFAEISMQLRERDNTPQKTDVLALNAELLEVVNENDHAIASVRMSGQLSENNGAAESFAEIWHVQKDLRDDKSVWLLSGIQQIN
jgi:predicted lipid-binding transport protein (Tim44 family)